MCFKNLPIEFDEDGTAHLREGVPNPYAYATADPEERQRRIEEMLAKNGHIKEVNIDPVTRVAGSLAFHSVVDMENRKVHDAHSMATLFRGYEVILKGRDPRDAIFISSRACGVCGGVHANAAAEAIEMAMGVAPRRWASSSATWVRLPSSCMTIRSTCSCWLDPTIPR